MKPIWASSDEQEQFGTSTGQEALQKDVISNQQVGQQPDLRIPAEYEPVSTVIMAYDTVISDMLPDMIASVRAAGSSKFAFTL